ncbi:MAG TPA: nucleoside monophosphate kinase [Acidimicrobiales bacterium]|nr:nucleoside monophosphate kinase [Acidimicrobiales bacterium]
MGERARLIVLGRQGAGKGTQCVRLAERLGVPHRSTGDLLRAEVAAATPLGKEVADHLEEGRLVPDDLVLDLVATTLGSPRARAAGYLLDGFPRTLAQGQALFEVLGRDAAHLAIELYVPTEVVRPRLAARRVCLGCGAVTSAPAGGPECRTCTECDGEVARRADDTDEAIKRRLALYEQESCPLLIWFDRQGLLTSVNGVGEPEEVFARLTAVVDAALASRSGGAGLLDSH